MDASHRTVKHGMGRFGHLRAGGKRAGAQEWAGPRQVRELHAAARASAFFYMRPHRDPTRTLGAGLARHRSHLGL